MIVQQLDYELLHGSSSRFNQKIFGRLLIRRKEDDTKAYYIPGVFDEIPHFRIFEGRIIVGTTEFVDFDPIMKYCKKFKLSTTEKEDTEIHLRTGKQKWQFHAKEKGLTIVW